MDEDLDLCLEDRVLNGASDAALPDALSLVLGGDDGLDSAAIEQELTLREAMESEHLETTRRPMKNPSRERLKRELGFLRERVAELEKELATLCAQKRRRTTAPRDDDETGAIVPVASWQDVAEGEKVKRHRSERENERLRRTLEQQLGVATQLSLYLRDRAIGSTVDEDDGEGTVTPVSPLLMSSSLDSVLHRILYDIDRAYAATESVLATIPGLDELPDERVCVSTVKTRRCKGREQLYIEILDTAHRFAEYEKTCEAAWEATRQVYANEVRVIEMGPRTEDFMAARYRSTGQTRSGTKKNLVVTFASKRFVEPHRTTLVWRAYCSPAQHDPDTPIQALSDETGWMVLTRVPEGVSNRPPGTAFMQACSRVVPMWFDGNEPDSSVRSQLAIGEFTNVVLSATEADISGFENAFQRLMLDDIPSTPPSDEDDPKVLVAHV